ncbi:hypothetical protein N656DRAFT_513912 [Canariomyces notabilis]|uniref:Uncharacterized protein n=1 Tax=Canariomyces notabilis TaxID=2074819 RepID=A0AAN6QBV3_9PEZI|nr:hypothetical protein N656DRAFT_513912 [Canariomyces arenarius]
MWSCLCPCHPCICPCEVSRRNPRSWWFGLFVLHFAPRLIALHVLGVSRVFLHAACTFLAAGEGRKRDGKI